MPRLAFSLASLAFLAATARADGPKTFELQTTRNVVYYDGKDADPVRHKLDIHVPKGHKDFPVVMFIHGGAWTKGNKDHLGVYTRMAQTLARHGIGVVCPNYRLSPAVEHPEHIRDVARAFAWTHKNIHKYGGRADELFVSGHSAGGHLCALLATDETYLKAEGLSLKDIKGCIPISGVFIIPPKQALFNSIFGKDPEGRMKASPISHVRPDAPPFLIFCGDNDLPGCDKPGAEAFCKALSAKQCTSEFCEMTKRNHMTILWNAAVSDLDPLTQRMLSFVMAQVTLDRMARQPPARVLADYGDFLARYIGNVEHKK